MALQRLTMWTLLTIFLACCSLVVGQCGNGIVDGMEHCDDNNTVDNDGCNSTCHVEDHFVCTNMTNTISDCVAILLDLNVTDETSLDREDIEYFDTNEPVFLVEPTTLDFFVRREANWTYLDIVVLEGVTSIPARVDLEYADSSLLQPITQTLLPSVNYRSGVNGRNVSSGMRVLIESALSSMTEDELRMTLEAVVYVDETNPNNPVYSPRDVCLIANDPRYTTTACVTLYYIGHNSYPPNITYDTNDVALFIEGQSEPVSIVVGNISVQDIDHPTRFLIESASARIVGYSEGNEEWLSLNTNPAGLIAAFNTTTGTLTITGSATTDVYSTVLEQITYFNNMSQPDDGLRRSVEVVVEDGMHTSVPVTIPIDIMNINDAPLVSLNGEVPVVEYTISYTEGAGAVPVVPNLHVLDVDPSPIIVRATVELTNALDGEDEVLNITDVMGLTVNSSGHILELSGPATPAVYTEALRTVTYHHLSANPSTQDRLIEFTAEDADNGTSVKSILTLNIIPVNDDPLLSFLSGGEEQSYTYIEDDPPIYIGQSITLSDVDSSIMSMSLYIENKLDGDQDSFGYDLALVETLSLSVTTWRNGTSSNVLFTGEASDTNYTQILRSLTYTNLYTNNSVTDGQRRVTISATDSKGGTTPQSLTLLVNVAERNDGPAIDLGDGSDVDFTITYTENGPCVGIGLEHLIEVMDEEGHSISSMDIELVSTNGPLDEGDLLLLQTPMALLFIFDPNTELTNTFFHISLPGDSTDYMDALRAVKYINTEDEPTLFVNGTDLQLARQIIIRITDERSDFEPTTNEVRVTVLINPINDNAPRIIINSDPVCTEDSDDHTVNRRSLPPLSMSSHKRRRRSSTHTNHVIAGPQPVEIVPSFTHTDINGSCLSQLVVVFNTDTSAPVVEVQKELDSLLTFAPASLAKTPHYGYWRDYRTLVVVFRQCVLWEEQQHSTKPLYVVFYGQDGFCNRESPCNKGICYYNSTGCPVVGYFPVHGRTSSNNTDTADVEDTAPGYLSYNCHFLIVLLSILLVAMVTVWLYTCKRGQTQQSGRACANSSVKKPALATHVIDIHTAAVTTSPTKLPPEAPQAREKQSLGGTDKDEYLPPYYSPGTASMLSPASGTHVPEIVVNSPNKPPPNEGVALQDVLTPATASSGGCMAVGQDEGDSECSTGERKVEDVLRGPLNGTAADSSPEFQQRRQARERGGVARAHGNDCSRQSREHSHHSQHCNNTPHPH